MSTSSHAIAVAVAVTAAFTLLIAVIFFYFFQRFYLSRHRQRHKLDGSFRREAGVNQDDIKKLGGNVKGLIVEENGVDILYIRQSGDRHMRAGFPNSILNPSYEDGDEEEKKIDVMVEKSRRFKIQETPLLYDPQCVEDRGKPESRVASLHFSVSAATLPPGQQLKSTQLPQPSSMVLAKKTQPPTPPPPPPPPLPPPPPPPPPPLLPPPAPSPLKKEVLKVPILSSSPQPPPPKASGLISSFKPPTAPKASANFKNGGGQTRLKPLHWDKVVANVDHSTVWDQINDGSFSVDDQLMETLFGYSTNNKSHERNKTLSISSGSNSSAPTQIFILEVRKSQNTAIVLKSLAVSRKGILEAILDGQGLSADTLEKLTKVAPTQEEEAKIINFDGNPDKLADAESFLYFILKSVPTAFTRLNVMHFRSSYDCEVLQLKEHLQTIELGCKELRTSGLFLKLLEAILKAGNRMNAGTSRGNAQAFNLSALRKLPDVKSTDGKTSLLHFIVQQVVQSEGKRHATCQNQELQRSKSDSDSLTKQEQDKEYLLLGLPVLGALSDELSQVKRAANIEFQSFITMYSTLDARVSEIRQIITSCGNNERGGFVREMKEFLEGCEEELKVVKEEQKRIMDLVNKTNEYYQAGVSKDKISDPFQLFAIVKDFLDMVDQACAELQRKIEKKTVEVEAISTPPLSPTKRVPLRFPNFDLHFLSNTSETTSSSHGDDDF